MVTIKEFSSWYSNLFGRKSEEVTHPSSDFVEFVENNELNSLFAPSCESCFHNLCECFLDHNHFLQNENAFKFSMYHYDLDLDYIPYLIDFCVYLTDISEDFDSLIEAYLYYIEYYADKDILNDISQVISLYFVYLYNYEWNDTGCSYGCCNNYPCSLKWTCGHCGLIVDELWNTLYRLTTEDPEEDDEDDGDFDEDDDFLPQFEDSDSAYSTEFEPVSDDEEEEGFFANIIDNLLNAGVPHLALNGLFDDVRESSKMLTSTAEATGSFVQEIKDSIIPTLEKYDILGEHLLTATSDLGPLLSDMRTTAKASTETFEDAQNLMAKIGLSSSAFNGVTSDVQKLLEDIRGLLSFFGAKGDNILNAFEAFSNTTRPIHLTPNVALDRFSSFLIQAGITANGSVVVQLLVFCYHIYQAITSEGSKMGRFLKLISQLICQILFGALAGSAISFCLTNLIEFCVNAGTSTDNLELNSRLEKEFQDACKQHGLKEQGMWKKFKAILTEAGLLARNTTFIIAAITVLYKLLKSLYTWALDNAPISWVFKDPAVREFVELVYFFKHNEDVLSSNIHCMQIIEDLSDLRFKIGMEMISERNPFNSSQVSVMSKVLADYDEMRRKISQHDLGTGSYRFDPLCVWLYGGTGLGKSALVSLIAVALREVDGTFVRDDVTWTPAPGSKFADGYKSQPIVFFDDFNQIQQQAQEEDVKNFFAYMTPNDTIMNMAALEDKGTYFRSKVVVVASNESHKHYRVASPIAFLRRRHLVIELVPKPGQKWNGEPFNYDHIDFNLMDKENNKYVTKMINGQPVEMKGLTWLEIAKLIQEAWIERRREQMANISHLQGLLKITGRSVTDLESLKAEYAKWFSTPRTEDEKTVWKTAVGFCQETFEKFQQYVDSCMPRDVRSEAKMFYEKSKDEYRFEWTQTEALGWSQYLSVVPWKPIISVLGCVVGAFGVYKFFAKETPAKVELNGKLQDNTEYFVNLRKVNLASDKQYETYKRASGTGILQVRDRLSGNIYAMDDVMSKLELNAGFEDTIGLLQTQIYSLYYNGKFVVTVHHVIKDQILINNHVLSKLSQKEVTLENFKGQKYQVYLHDGLSQKIPYSEFSLVKIYSLPLVRKTFFNLLPKDADLVDRKWSKAQTVTFSDRVKTTIVHPNGTQLMKSYKCMMDNKEIMLVWNWAVMGYLKGGDCGALLLSTDPAVNRKVLGFHFANVVKGDVSLYYCLTQEVLEACSTQLQVEIEGVNIQEQRPPTMDIIEGNSPDWLRGNLEYVGDVPKHLYNAESRNHDIQRSPCYGEIFPATKDLSVLSKYDSRLEEKLEVEILHKGVLKYASTIRELSPEMLDIARRVVRDEVSNYRTETGSSPRVWTLDEAINGQFRFGDEGRYTTCPGLNMDSSAGYPFVKPQGELRKGKRWLFSEIEHPRIPGCPIYTLVDKQCLDLLEAAWNDVLDGYIPFCVWKNCKKSEKRDIEKVKSGSTRVFTVSPVHITLIFRRLFGDFTSAMKLRSKQRQSVAKVGINPDGLDWDQMINYLWSFGAEGFALDYSSWDAKVSGQLFSLFAEVVNAWYGDAEEFQRARIVLCKMACHTYTLCGGSVIQKHQGNNSGSAITTELNCIANLATNVAAAVIVSEDNKAIQPRHFLKDFAIFIYGDDVVIVPRTGIMSQPLVLQWKDALESFGHVVTDAEKIFKIPRAKAVTDLRFLKRQTNVLEHLDHTFWVSALDKESIEQSCNFVSNNQSVDPLELLSITFDTMMSLSWPHGKDYYDYVAKKIFEWSSQNGCKYMSPPFESQKNRYIREMRRELGLMIDDKEYT